MAQGHLAHGSASAVGASAARGRVGCGALVGGGVGLLREAASQWAAHWAAPSGSAATPSSSSTRAIFGQEGAFQARGTGCTDFNEENGVESERQVWCGECTY